MLFVILLMLLHVLKSDIDPSWHFISEYEIGPHGWLMQTAFIALAVGNLATYATIRHSLVGLSGKIGSALFLVGAVGVVLGGVFVTDPVNTNPEAITTNGKLHNLGGGLGLAGFIGSLIFSIQLIRHAPSRSVRRMMWLATIVLIAGFLVSFVSIVAISANHSGVFSPETPVGWPNRLGILSACCWLVIVSLHARRD